MITWPVDFYGFVASNLGENDDSPVHHSMGWHPILRETQRDWYMCLERDNGGSAYRQHNTTRGDVVEAFTIQCPQNRPAQKRGQKKGQRCSCVWKKGDAVSSVYLQDMANWIGKWSTLIIHCPFCSDNPVLVFAEVKWVRWQHQPPHCRLLKRWLLSKGCGFTCSSPFSQVCQSFRRCQNASSNVGTRS
jgi:hypothetical protein